MATPAAEPIFFGPAPRPRAGWLHRPAVPSASGVVVCSPFGYEAICARRSLRHLAESMAEAGIAALRFDYDGTGDSAGGDRDPDRLGAWVESVRDACRSLRELAGVERVWLVGVRLGVLLAALASGADDLRIAGLVAIAPVVSGKAYLRELALLQMSLGLAEPPPGRAAEIGDGGQEAVGFVITPETKKALAAVDLAKMAPFRKDSPFEVLLLDRSDLPTGERWASHLEAQGASVERALAPGYVEMMLDPHKALVPGAIIQAATAWVSARAGDQSSEHPRSTPRLVAELGDVVERPVFVDAARRVFGILSSPTGTPSGRGIVFLNAGAIHHVGPNRLYVTLARRWAALGFQVLRLDIGGIGDSRARAGDEENVVYRRAALEDVRAAVAFLRREHAVDDVRAVGLCAGAYHAIKAAASDPAVAGFVAINPLTFVPPPEGPVDFPDSRVAAEAERYQRSAFDPAKWKKLLRGDVHVRVMLRIFARHAALRVKTGARNVSRRLHLPLKDDVGVELERLARRRAYQSFVFAKGDPGRRLLQEQGGSAVAALEKRGALTIDVIDGPDHTFTATWSHEPLATILTAAITRAGR